MGFCDLTGGMLIMWAVSFTLFYLAISKGFEPLLLIPIGFGALLANLPTEGMTNKPSGWLRSPKDGIIEKVAVQQGDTITLPRVEKEGELPVAFYLKVINQKTQAEELLSISFESSGRITRVLAEAGQKVVAGQPIVETHSTKTGGFYHYISLGIILEIFPPVIFLGVGALTDFGPLIANPVTLILGAAAQLGIFFTVVGASLLGFSMQQAASIGIIGGADGPTSIFLANKLAPELLAPIAVAAYSYMSLVPLIQPPIMRLLTTKKERLIRMKSLRHVSRMEKIIFATVVAIACILIVPDASALIAMLMLGNFLRESGVTERLTKSAQNEIINIVTIFLGTSVGITMTSDRFLSPQTLKILALGIVAFSFSTAGGVLMAKALNLFYRKNPINPLIGSAGVSAVPMAARVSHVEGQRADPHNYLLMHAMGPNVAGVIGTAVVAGYFIATLS
ncbi:MAG: glutaconyl-CoA decarboxylase subunit beta [Verrucomicrobia bacterium GWF2_51_19]|nr:MAG: glutaconyl-CoA decarboxylase subunit beta [Verrucomicrobia bacterium GWF2_51_19]